MSRLHQHYVVHVLRHDSGFVPELDLVMERGGALYIEGNIDFYDKSCFVVDGIKGTRYHKAPEQEIPKVPPVQTGAGQSAAPDPMPLKEEDVPKPEETAEDDPFEDIFKIFNKRD